jgi:hypothetical protein
VGKGLNIRKNTAATRPPGTGPYAPRRAGSSAALLHAIAIAVSFLFIPAFMWRVG